MSARRWWTGPVLAAALAGLFAAPVVAQDSAPWTDAERGLLLREAAELEARGDYGRAEELLRRILDEDPGTAAAVFTLERILRNEQRHAEILPVIEAYLETDRGGSAVRALELRVLATMDSTSALEAAVRRWIESEPGSLDPYEEGVRYFRDELGPEPALELIREARERTGDEDAFAMEAGDLHAELGDAPGAVREWSRSIDRAGRSVPSIIRRIGSLPGDTDTLVESLVDHLHERGSADHLRAGARAALDAGFDESAIALASAVLPDLELRARKGFLAQFAQRAEERREQEVALWGYQRLRAEAESGSEARSLDYRIAEMALTMGDTARTLEAWDRVVESLPEGTSQRRRAMAARLELRTPRLEPEAAVEAFTGFRNEFPEAPELDALAAGVAGDLMARGEDSLVDDVLSDVRGPESALARAYVRLAREDVDEGIDALERAVDGLRGARATEALDLLELLEGAGPRGAALAGRVAALAQRDEPEEALQILEDGLAGVSLDDRPGLLALGARVAESAGRAERAATLRARLVEDHPDADEMPEAAVRLARHRAGADEVGEAARILETLILARPESAVVPEARRELERLRTRAPDSSSRQEG